ncbi:hypothetical protein HAPAU_36140 [Halalkalicoccus paucihalophilus]|uniref:Uncharacterized protein n=1 Tax=Halalkalicoccus paucihalophilus TaxID=1008153 RepID=A0A151AAB9_9EURY|nr:hypothetical protein HAPAU_36140 [Halalkalicoccus paucihalophilus]
MVIEFLPPSMGIVVDTPMSHKHKFTRESMVIGVNLSTLYVIGTTKNLNILK